ncbi:MAG: glycosyltransferase N-terminal domain-containing protein [Paracoccaceae bacterium]|jgi:3-deoxy-D-manno-octulosonic-acid transferase
MILNLYLFFANFTLPIWRIILRWRVKNGKEDPVRYKEKLGQITTARPDGPMLWFHALSVGESLALMTLLRRLGVLMPDTHFVLTTNTVTSVLALNRIGLPPRVIHQFLPADSKQPVQSFLNHWKPSLVAVAELDLWPYALTQVKKRKIPLILINGRVTDKTYKKHIKRTNFISSVLALFDVYLTQEMVSEQRIIELGAPAHCVKNVGALKVSADPLPDLPTERMTFRHAVGARPIWLAASTHFSEEPQLFDAHKLAREAVPNLLLVIVPRHIKDAFLTQRNAEEQFSNVLKRSSGVLPDTHTEVYIADTFGEMGLWCRIANITFIGHSMPVPHPILTGKNPFEALALGQMVLHGPDFGNFDEIYQSLLKRNATRTVLSSTALAQDIIDVLNNHEFKNSYVLASQRLIAEGEVSINETAAVLSMKVLEYTKRQ